MSGDEVIVTIASMVLGIGGWALWLFRAGAFDDLRPGRSPVSVVGWTLAGLTVIIVMILRLWAADDVRHAPEYMFMYSLAGLAWLLLANLAFPFVGLHPRDDLIERGNVAALWAWIGAMTGVALAYVGGNIGNGPGWWVVVLSAVLATATLGGLWLAVGQKAGLAEAVTIDRDPAAGVRLGGLLTAGGLICGGAVTGDWVSAQLTVADFIMRAWPIVPLALIAMGVEGQVGPRPERPRPPMVAAGIGPAMLYLALAVFVVQWFEVLG